MNTGCFVFFVVFISFSQAWFYGRPDPGLMTHGGVWPQPWNLTNYAVLPINPDSFIFNSWHSGCEIIDKALVRYKKLAFPGHVFSKIDDSLTKAAAIASVTVSSQAGCSSDYPQFDMDESYTIQASGGSTQALIIGKTVWGALRGLETFSQLIFKANGTWWIQGAVINDRPRFPHRGIMVDSSRHFLSVNVIKRQIDLMAQNKMNVFHWHLVDSESFPYTSTKFPDISAKGAYTPKHVYTVAQMKDIIEFARLRGIRVVPEFDTPGHTGAWGAGVPGLLSLCYNSQGVNNILGNIIDPTKDANWQFLTDFFGEALDFFKDGYFHFGGDETDTYMLQCWERNKDVLNWMQNNGFGKDTTKLLNYYFQKLVKLVQTHKNTTMIFWQEVLDMNVAPAGSVAHVWKGNNLDEIMQEMYTVTAAGHRALLSSCWYLNYIKYGADWPDFYACDPQHFGGTDEQNQLVLGGEAAIWGEFVDGTNLTPRLWPRASAVAERLWSDPGQTSSSSAAWPRLHEHRCRMMSRGYEVEPPNDPDYCPDFWDPQYPDMQT